MAVLGHHKSETVETIFFKISLPVWVSNVTFSTLSRGWKAPLILPAEHEFEKQLLLSVRLYDWPIAKIS